MGYELGGAYIGQMMAKDAMHKAMYGKATKKKASFISRMLKKMAKICLSMVNVISLPSLLHYSERHQAHAL